MAILNLKTVIVFRINYGTMNEASMIKLRKVFSSSS